MNEFLITVNTCPRCYHEHPLHKFVPLLNSEGQYNLWAECPNVKQPIFASVHVEQPNAVRCFATKGVAG
jgi:hypothetical protein